MAFVDSHPQTDIESSIMQIAYLDCASGISGDMMLGALIDAGIAVTAIQEKLDSLNLPSCRLAVEDVKRCGFRAIKLNVEHEPEHAHRHLHHISALIEQSQLTPTQQQLAHRIFLQLAKAEAKVHGSTIEKVHFHEVGAVDSIADIVGVAVGLDLLGVEKILCSAIPTGRGFIQIAHGRCSIPAPATAELLRNIPIAESQVEAELTTPTGAAIVATVVNEFGSLPPFTIKKIGYGAGDHDFKAQANILRLLVGEQAADMEHDTVAVLETNVDDVSAEAIGHCVDRLLHAGALDVFCTPILMKKNRPGVQVTVLCELSDTAAFESVLFSELRTLGIRRTNTTRRKLKRDAIQVDTIWGPVAAKRVVLPHGESRVVPEYESCRRIAIDQHISLQDVMDQVTRSAENES